MRYSKATAAPKRIAVGAAATVALIGLVSGCSSDSKDTAASTTTVATTTVADQNLATVQALYDLAAIKHKPQEAADTYIGDVYTQHNPNVANGKAGFVTVFTEMYEKYPQMTTEFKHWVAQGDLVSVYSLMKTSSADRGTVVADLFRVQDGKVVEHWEVLAAVAESSVNGNSQI